MLILGIFGLLLHMYMSEVFHTGTLSIEPLNTLSIDNNLCQISNSNRINYLYFEYQDKIQNKVKIYQKSYEDISHRLKMDLILQKPMNIMYLLYCIKTLDKYYN